jgi:hypothetical protein
LKGKRRLAAGALAAVGLVAGLTVASQSSVGAASGPVFTVMNTSETPPDGVWFRNSPHTSDTDRVTGHGIYVGDRVQLQCYAWGDAVGAYANQLWYYVNNTTRPAVPNGAPNVGYLNAHYVNDGAAANVVDAGVGQCGAPTPPAPTPPPSPITLFYSPFDQNQVGTHDCGSWCGQNLNLLDQSVNTSYLHQWFPNYPHGCGDIGSAYNAATPAGRYPTTLAGWSLGRLGPSLTLLQAARQGLGSSILQNINYVLLIDPGPYGDLSVCDRSINAGGAFANWLQLNPNAHLVVISGNLSQQNNSKGIQEVYFNEIRNIANANHSNIRSQVLVCNYPIDHFTAYFTGQYWIRHQIGWTTSSCPWLTGQGRTYKPTAGWHP